MYKGVIIVGGPSRVTNFRPLSLRLPKPLFPVAGLPLIEHQVAALSRVPGMSEVLLIGFYEPDLFVEFAGKCAQTYPSIKVRYLREFEPLGTAGGLHHFRDQIMRGDPQAVFVVQADIASSFPLPQLLKFHHEQRGTMTLMGKRVPRDQTVGTFGCVVAEAGSGRVLHYVEKPESFVSDLISCGVYVCAPIVFAEELPNIAKLYTLQIIRRLKGNENIRLEQDLLVQLSSKQQLFVYESLSDFWCPIKTAASTVTANRLYLEFYGQQQDSSSPIKLAEGENIVGPVYIDPSAKVSPTSLIGPNVSIGPGCIVGEGARIRDAILLPACSIARHAVILNSIIGWSSSVGQWGRVEGAPDDQLDSEIMTVNGVKKPSITILGEDIRVGDERVVRNCIVLPHKELTFNIHNEIVM